MNRDGTLSLRDYPVTIENASKRLAEINKTIRSQQEELEKIEATLSANVYLNPEVNYKNADERSAALDLNRANNQDLSLKRQALSESLYSKEVINASLKRLNQEFSVLLNDKRQATITSFIHEGENFVVEMAPYSGNGHE